MRSIERLSDLFIFSRIVADGSLSAAARELNISTAVISARLSGLEETLGARLLNRSTRTLSLTEEGAEFLARATDILGAVADLENKIGGRAEEPRGRLRITATPAFARRHIAPRIAKFRHLYPKVTMELIATDTVIDLVKEGIDLAIRQSILSDSALKVRTVIANRRIACASPSYIAAHGKPGHPNDLMQHDCIVIGMTPMVRWPFTRLCSNGQSEEINIDVPYVLQTNDGDVAHSAALAGAGVALKSMIDVSDDLSTGRLLDLFPQWLSPGASIQAVYPAGKHLSSKVRLFIDFLTEELAGKLLKV